MPHWMIYIVVEELVPEAHKSRHSHVATIGVVAGFIIMMMLDLGLG